MVSWICIEMLSKSVCWIEETVTQNINNCRLWWWQYYGFLIFTIPSSFCVCLKISIKKSFLKNKPNIQQSCGKAHLLSRLCCWWRCHCWTIGKILGLESESPGFEFQLHYLLTLLGWASYWLLWTYFLICKQGWLLPTHGLQNKWDDIQSVHQWCPT